MIIIGIIGSGGVLTEAVKVLASIPDEHIIIFTDECASIVGVRELSTAPCEEIQGSLEMKLNEAALLQIQEFDCKSNHADADWYDEAKISHHPEYMNSFRKSYKKPVIKTKFIRKGNRNK